MSNTDLSINIGAIIKLFGWSICHDNKNPVRRKMYVWYKRIEGGGIHCWSDILNTVTCYGLKNINPCYFYNNVYITELIITVSSLSSSLSSVASKSSIIMISICFIYALCLLSRINLFLLFVLVSWFISRDLYNCFIVSRSWTPYGDYNCVLDKNKYRDTLYMPVMT